jgi:hypothetical protein
MTEGKIIKLKNETQSQLKIERGVCTLLLLNTPSIYNVGRSHFSESQTFLTLTIFI